MVSPYFATLHHHYHAFLLPHATPIPLLFVPRLRKIRTVSVPKMLPLRAAARVPDVTALQGALVDLLRASPPTWGSAVASNLLIFVLGSPLLVTGLTGSGIAAAFLLGTLTWRAFGPSGFLLVATYFVIGTGVTKLKIKQKEAMGVAEKRRGRRGPGSVIGSSAAGCVCALLSIYGAGGVAFLRLWQLGFVASFCTKLSDTVSSEIGKAYGKTTRLRRFSGLRGPAVWAQSTRWFTVCERDRA
ncbi:hypothetical protein Taro_032384 [Colocasia esculenta]|uniref:Uncharacterized protein n=1 Tax=Colocasia esculenta TaxID=4460 RepID=A0A843W1S2_COLES|nr:hypothetical protein [Colocasia esculenta]